MNTAPDYEATLAGWWDEATPDTPIHPGDLVINNEDGDYSIYEAQCEWRASKHARVLIPHTPPTPAWHDAVAVIAHTKDDDTRRAFTPRHFSNGERSGAWDDRDGGWEASLLIDPVPLIEARVTDEAINRIVDVINGHDLCGGDGLPIEEDTLIALARAALGIGDDK